MQLEEQQRRHDSIEKMLTLQQMDKRAKSPSTPVKGVMTFKDAEDEVVSLDKSIRELKGTRPNLQLFSYPFNQQFNFLIEDIAVLDSGNKTMISLALGRLGNRNSGGHQFKIRQYHQPMDCAHCQDALWGHRILECSSKLVHLT
jgi:hypothetical protein